MSVDVDRFSVVAPMQTPAVDDTESGLAVTSAIIEHAKKRKPILDASQELAAAPLLYSKLNNIAIACAEKNNKEKQQSLLASTAARTSSGYVIDARRASQRAESAGVVHLGSDASAEDGGAEEPSVLISFRTNVPLQGKTCFTIPHRMSEPIAALRRNIVHAMATKPTGQVSILRSDTGEALPLEATLLDCGFRFPPLLRLTGFHHEMHLVCAAPLGVRVPVPWAPSMTLTDMLQHVHKRLAPRDLRHVRLSISAAPGSTPDGLPARSPSAASARRYLDIQRCFVPRPPQCADARSTLHDLGFCATADDPVSITWLRSKEGCPLFFTIPFSGRWSMGDVAVYMDALSAGNPAPGDGDGATSLADFLCDATAMDAAMAHTAAVGGCAMDVLQNATPFDDEDEEVFFEGRNGMEEEADANVPTEGNGAKGRCSAAAAQTPPRGLFVWSHAEVDAVHGAGRSAQFGVVVSFCPPPSAMATARPPLRFVPIDEDFLIPHLTDACIYPGAEVLVEFYDPMTRRWSGDVSHAVCSLLDQTATSEAAGPWTRRAVHTTGPQTADSAVFPKHELLTIRSVESTAIVRVPCTPTCSIETIQWMYWMCTGYLPMLNVLLADNGRLLCPFESMASANLLPQTTLFNTHRPCAWLKEALPDLSRLAVTSTARLFSTTESPNL